MKSFSPGIYIGVSQDDYRTFGAEDPIPVANQSTLKKFIKDPWTWRNSEEKEEKKAHQEWGTLFETLLLEPDKFDDRYVVLDELQKMRLLKEHNSKVPEVKFSKRLGHYRGWCDEMVEQNQHLIDLTKKERDAELDGMLTDEVKQMIVDKTLATKARKDFDPKIKEYVEWAGEMKQQGKTIVDHEMSTEVQLAVQSAMENPTVERWVQYGEKQVMVVWDDVVTGVRCKALLDWVADGDNAITDIKTTRDTTPHGFEREIITWGYHIQASFYTDGWKQALAGTWHEDELYADRPAFRFIASNNVSPYACETYVLPPWHKAIERGRDIYREALTLWKACHESGNFPRATDGWQEIAERKFYY